MMECMLYCYINKIKFVLYADDANFTNGHGWNEFFDEFCEVSHDKLNSIANIRYPVNNSIKYKILWYILKFKTKSMYLTSDMFAKCIPRIYAMNTNVKWDLFKIDGTIFNEFGKLHSITL